MAARTAGRKGRPFRRARERVLKSRVCWICGHGGAQSVDHDPPLKELRRLGLDPNDPRFMRPAHGIEGCPDCPWRNGKPRRCNQSKGARPLARHARRGHTSYRW